MNRLLPLVVCAAVFAGCRTHDVTPDESWADYGRYYSATGAAADATDAAVDVRMVPSDQTDATVESLKAQGNVVLGTFKIEDGTDISIPAVVALAKKLNASTAVWSSLHAVAVNRALPNPDMGIEGVDKTLLAEMEASRPDQTVPEQLLEPHHVIWMLGKKTK